LPYERNTQKVTKWKMTEGRIKRRMKKTDREEICG
jgi:hypothetical protein